jgi:hypothetical protein
MSLDIVGVTGGVEESIKVCIAEMENEQLAGMDVSTAQFRIGGHWATVTELFIDTCFAREKLGTSTKGWALQQIVC